MAPKDDTLLEFLSVCKKLAKHLGEFKIFGEVYLCARKAGDRHDL